MATRSAKIDQKADLIWAIADKLTGVYKPHEYGDVILPLTVIRRFDCILSDTKDAVLQKYDEVKNLPMKDILLRKASKKDFYNTSKYTFERLMDDPDHIEENFREYLNKFSANVRDILEKFKFDGHITTMANKGILYIVLKEYTTDRGNLHPNEISNLEMGYIFEEIIRRFSESHNEDAGQHYTPREVIQLMVNILFYDDNDILSGNNVAKTIYDPACGTGGMLSVAEEYLHSLNASTELVSFGQEINDQTFAICKADMLIKGNNADYIKDGNTLSDDQFAGSTFDYILSNPPFGREWKNEKAKVEEEAKLGFGGRFGAGLPAASDGQMLFLMTAISKMKDIDKGGSRIAIIHNGSPLFTGDAGSGPSEIRRHILENDLLEAIIALPNDIFYNTGIATYIWVLSNKKAGTVREGKVQLMRDSGVEWIGEIPKDWNCCKQKYRFTLINGRAFKDNEFEEDGTYRILGVGNLFSNPVWYSSSLELEPDKYCEKGDLIYAWSMSYGPYIWNEEKVIYHYHIWKTKLVSDMDKMFSYYYLQALTESIKSQTHETTMGFVTMGIMNNSYIAYPRNIKEQKKISDYLDAKCSKIDEIIEKQLSIIEKLKEYKLSIITEAVTSGINPDVEMKDSGSVWFGNIPINWEMKRLKYVFHIQKDIAGEEGHTVLSITQRGIIPKDFSNNEGQFANSYANYQLVHKGDFAMNHMDLLTGWVDISKYEGVTSPDYRVFVLNDKNGMCPKYYLYMMQMCYSARIFYGLGQGVSGMGRWRLQADKFLNFYIPIPPYDEQKKIADYITDKVNHIEVEIDKRNKLIKKYQEYKKSLIYEVVTGKKEV